MADRKERFALVAYFEKMEQRYTGTKTVINRYSGQWDADAIIESYGLAEAKELVNRYLKVSQGPTWKRFVNNADRVYYEMLAENQDKADRKKMRELAKEWMK